MGNVCVAGPKDTFNWRIEGFSSLCKLPGASCVSRPFKFGGYSWNLMIQPRNIYSNSGKEYMGLYLQLENASSLPLDLVLDTAFEFCVYDHLRNDHVTKTGESKFWRQAGVWGFSIINHDRLKQPSGYILNDTCNVSVKIRKVRSRKVCPRISSMSECLSLEEKPAAQMFTWKIENFAKLPRPEATSENFVAGGHKWNIRVYPDGKKSSDHLGIFLELHTTPALSFKSELYVGFSLSLLDQINGQHKKFTAKRRFSKDASKSDLIELLPLDDFQDPLKGYLVENACVIEASVTVLGSSTGTEC